MLNINGTRLYFEIRQNDEGNPWNSWLKGTIMQIEKALINDRLHVSKVSFEKQNFASQLFIILQ